VIHRRVLDLFRRGRLRPQDILAVSEEELRGAGLSGAKLAALRDLAAKTLDGTVPALARLRRMDDEEIIERLTEVRGIGRWTAEMLLMFRLGRPDVLPVGDYAVRKGFALTYGLEEMPKPKVLESYGERWRPYRSVASWYMWRALEIK
jgi:DNA-3-methyladenine glycosylase II